MQTHPEIERPSSRCADAHQPVVWLLVFLNFFTRQSLSVARLDGFEKELGISSTDFSLAISIHYTGYLLVQVPSNMLLTKIPPPVYLSLTMGIMAVGTALTAVLHNGRSLLIQRFFLGLIAAPIYPGCIYVISLFYKRKELAARVTLIYTASIFATGMNGLVAAPIFRAMRGMLGLSGWRWLYIIFGTISVVISALSFFILPDEPLKTKWLTPAERRLAHDRIAGDTVERKEKGSMVQGLREALRDRRVWMFMLIQHVNAFAGSIRIFLPTLLATLGKWPFMKSHRSQADIILNPNPRLQPVHNPRHDLPTLSGRLRLGDGRVHLVRALQRADVAPDVAQDARSRGVLPRRRRAESVGALLCRLRLHHWHLGRHVHHAVVDRQHMCPDQGEEGRRHRSG